MTATRPSNQTAEGGPPPDSGESVSLAITRADNGAEISVHDLVRIDDRPLVWSLNSKLRLVRRRLEGDVVARSRPVHRFTLASGRELEVTSGQRLLAVDGWKAVSQLRCGSRIGTTRRLGAPLRTQRMHESEVIMLAHMIGDGSCVKRQPVRYASIDAENLEAVTNAALHFGVTAIRDDYAAARVTTLRLPAPYRLTRGRRNPIAAWLDELGLFGLRSHEKFLPATVFALPSDSVALFLRHLWSTDGSVRWDEKASQGRVYYASTSRRLIDDVMSLLLCLGVQSRITRTTKAGYRDCWFLTIDRAVNQVAFLTKVGVHGARGIKAREVVRQLDGRVRRPGADTIPVEIWDHIKNVLHDRGWSDEDFAAATNTRFDGSRMWTHAPGRPRLHRISTILEDATLHDLATNDIFWDKVVSIEQLGPRDTYEIVSADGQSYVTRGVILQPSAG
jgi:replicative DNA helicase